MAWVLETFEVGPTALLGRKGRGEQTAGQVGSGADPWVCRDVVAFFCQGFHRKQILYTDQVMIGTGDQGHSLRDRHLLYFHWRGKK